MTVALVAGGGFGLGLWLLLRGYFPGRIGLARRLADLDVASGPAPAPAAARTRAPAGRSEASPRELAIGRSLLTALDDLGLPLGRALGRDLAVTGQTLESLAARK